MKKTKILSILSLATIAVPMIATSCSSNSIFGKIFPIPAQPDSLTDPGQTPKEESYSVTIGATDGGTVSIKKDNEFIANTKSGSFNNEFGKGTLLEIKVNPVNGYKFIGWNNDSLVTGNEQEGFALTTKDEDIKLVALFGKKEEQATPSDQVITENEEKPIHTSVYWKAPKVADTIYTIDASKLSQTMYATLESLQGILAQTESRIFVYSGDELRDEWINDMQKTYGFETLAVSDPWALLEKFKDEFNSQYISFKPNNNNKENSINTACTLAGINKNIIIGEDEEQEAIKHGFTKSFDATTISTETLFNKYKDELNNTMLINQIPRDMALRDYAIASKSLCSYVDWENASVKSAIISWLEKDSPILGWTDDECPFVRDLSTDQLEIVPADHCANLSLYSAYNPNKVYKQKRQSQELVADPNKHYAAILMSDGDNVQWMQGEFRTNPWYGNANRGKFPMTWTVSPTTYDLNAQALDYIYGNQTDNDCFITSPSGFAYRNMGNCANNSKFTETSLKYMNDMDQHVVNFLDWNACNDPSKFEQFMKDPSVKGGVWSKGWLYMSGYGDINWVNDKPIISFREGLWNDTRSPGTIHNNLSVEEVSDRINEYPCDIESINGYTIVMCCCWALDGQMDRITEFVNRLAKHVELVTVDQLIDLAAKNIKSHKQATPDKHWW